MAAETRHIAASKELDVVASQVQNQYDMIKSRHRYIHEALDTLQNSRDMTLGRKEELLRLIGRRHRLRRLIHREVLMQGTVSTMPLHGIHAEIDVPRPLGRPAWGRIYGKLPVEKSTFTLLRVYLRSG